MIQKIAIGATITLFVIVVLLSQRLQVLSLKNANSESNNKQLQYTINKQNQIIKEKQLNADAFKKQLDDILKNKKPSNIHTDDTCKGVLEYLEESFND